MNLHDATSDWTAGLSGKPLSILFLLLTGPCLGILYLVVILLWRVIFGQLRTLPGPFMSKITGFDIKYAGFNGRRVHRLDELHAKYGSVVRIGPNEISISDWQYYRTIYSNPKSCVKEPGFYGAASFIGKDNIFQMTNIAQHSSRRRLSANPYSLQSLSQLDPIIREKADELVKRLIIGASSSLTGTVNAYELCGLYTFEVVCTAGFAKHFISGPINDDALKLMQSMDGSALTLIFDTALPFLSPLGLGPKLPGLMGDCYRKREYWIVKSREMVDYFLKNSTEDEKYLLTPLFKGTDAFLGRKLSTDELVEEAMGYMFAGSGTTSTTLTYLLYALSRPENAEIQRKLRDEVTSLPDDVVALRNNHYVNAVIKETFRLYPTIISTLPRVLTAPMQVSSYTLPAGTIVGMQNYIHHRNPAVFPDPDNFIPDRWSKSDEAMESSLTPFSIGKRGCIGQNLAWEELYIAINALMRAGIELRLGREMSPWEMNMEDRFNIAPKGRRLMLEVIRL